MKNIGLLAAASLAALAACAATGSPARAASPAASPVPAVPSSAPAKRPNLLFDARAAVPELRRRLAGPLKPVAEALRGAVDLPFQPGSEFPQTPDVKNQSLRGDIRGLADTVATYAFAALIFQNGGADRIFPELPPARRAEIAERARTLARNYLAGVTDPGFPDWLFPEYQEGTAPDLPMAHFLMSVSLAYDWSYERLSEPERARCRTRLADGAARMYAATQDPGTWWLSQYTQNHHWLNHTGLGMAALALGESSPDAEKWRATAARGMETVRTVIDPIAGGAWHEGIGYTNYGMLALLPFTIANQRLRNGPDFADTQFTRDYPIFRMYGMPGSAAHRREFLVYGDFSNFQNDDTLAIARYVARKHRDGRAAWYADAFTEGQRQGRGGLTSWPPGQRGIILSAILYDPAVKPTPPPDRGAAWDRDYFAPDLSMMVSRSGWTLTNDSLLAFKSGVYGGHAAFRRLQKRELPDENLNYGHDHADDMGVYLFADGEWLTTAVPSYYIGRGNNPVANITAYANSLLIDGKGQILEGPRSGSALHSPGFFDRVSGIPVRASTAHYSFCVGDGARLYDAKLGLKTFERSVLFVERRFPVVRDVVRGSDARRYEVSYHAVDAAAREGGWLRLDAKNDRVLGVRVVAPANFEARIEEQKAANLRNFDPDGAMTAVHVRPPADGADATFLTVLVPSRRAVWDARPKVEPLDAAHPDRGLTITDTGVAGERLEAVFSDTAAGSATAGGMTVTGRAGVARLRDGQVTRLMLADGTRLTRDGRTLLELPTGPPASVEADFGDGGGTTLALSGDAGGATGGVRVFAPGVTKVTWNGAEHRFRRDGEFVELRP